MSFAVTEEDFLSLAEALRPWTEQEIKIQVAPWIKEYVTDIDNLYTELTIEHLECNIMPKYIRVNDYRLIYEDSFREKIYKKSGKKSALSIKVVAQGDPGMGKTTLAKKIAWDWATGSFTRFFIVFFVFLKLVSPDDTIENVIIQQMPPLEGMGVSPGKVLQILNRFGSRCLLILDGLDEHALGQNLDVTKIIEGRKLLNCNIFLTSRPHSVSGIKKHFNTQVRVNGFTCKQAELFAHKILDNEKQVQDVLFYNPAGYREDIVLHKCPILLSFMCLLVRHDDIDLSSETINSGEIYAQMVRCLYKKFLLRQDREFDDNDFVTVLRKIGKLALNTLRTGKPLLKRSEVINQVGADAFNYGLLIGHEDFRLIADETADIFVTFPHRSIQEFLGALYFILCLIEGVSVQSLLGRDPEESLFLQNPLFFYFANWVACSSKDYFPTIQQKCGMAVEVLKSYILEHMDQGQLDLPNLAERFPSLDMVKMKEDDASLSILGDVLGRLRNVRDLKLYHFRSEQWNVSCWILTKLFSLLKTNLRPITLSELHCSFMPSIVTDDISIGLRGFGPEDSRMIIDSLVRLCSSADRHMSVFIFSLGRLELFSILHENIKSLYILETEPYIDMRKNPVSDAMPLERLCLKFASPSLASTLSKRARDGSLSRLTHLSIPAVHLQAYKDIPLVGCLFEKEWSQLTHLTLNNLTEEGFNELSQVIRQGKFRNISQLNLIFYRYRRFFLPYSRIDNMDVLQAEFLSFLKELTIHCLMRAQLSDIFEALATILRQEQRSLHKIDLSHNYFGTIRKLSILLKNEFPELHTLILSDCELNREDLESLTWAKVKGRIPELRHLDISQNDEICGHLDLLFDNSPSSTWNSLLSLNVEWSRTETLKAIDRQVCSPDLSLLSKKSSMLASLRELRVSAVNDRHTRMTSRWCGLTTLQVVCMRNGNSGILSSVAQAVEDSLLPRLETLHILNYSGDDYTWRSRAIDDEEKTTFGARQENLDVLRVANIAVLEYELEDEEKLADVGVNFCPFTQSRPNAGE